MTHNTSTSDPTNAATASLYALELLFNGAQVSADELRTKAQAATKNCAHEISLKVEATPTGCLLSLKGPLEAVDECHESLNAALLSYTANQPPPACIRLVDAAGDEVRSRAYPILSRIEQRLRAFINQKAVEVLGWDWWSQYAPLDLQQKVSKYVRRDPGVTLLEGTQFDDLVALITHEYADWEDDKSVSVAELKELIADSDSFEGLKLRFQLKTAVVSFWDLVFAPYFNDLSHWEQVKSSLGFVIKQRHKVMHHRPLPLVTVRVLVSKEQELEVLLSASKPSLPEPEREKVQQEVEKALPSYERDMERLRPFLMSEREMQDTLRRVNEMVPTSAKLAEMQRAYMAAQPSPEELQRIWKQIESAQPSLEQMERCNRLFEQGQEVLEKTKLRGMFVPDERTLRNMRDIQKTLDNLGPVLEQLQRFRGR